MRHGFAGRVQRDNIRRMLLVSVSFCLFLFVSIIFLQTHVVQSVRPYAVWTLAVLGEAYAGVHIWISYRWLSNKKKSNVQKQIYLFWFIYVVLMVTVSLLFKGTFSVLAVYWIMTSVLAIVPLWNHKEFFVSQGIQFIAIFLLVSNREFGAEIILYLLGNQLLCGIISRQSYQNFLQRTANEAEIAAAKNLAEIDVMTNMLNRRGLKCNLERIWPASIRNNMRIAVIMIDIDNFKKYNDYFGHLEGDNCICKVTEEIRKRISGKKDFAARVGGEEFVVCLTGVGKEEAVKWAIGVKEDIEGLRIPQAEDNFLPIVSVSIGVAWGYAGDNIEFTQMWKRADESLYKAKKNGRACICFERKCYARTKEEGSSLWDSRLDNSEKLA